MGEWVLSAGDGFSRRRNSAVPVGSVPTNIDQRLVDVASWYNARGLESLYRITPLCDPGIDRTLADHGYILEAPTQVMVRGLESLGRSDKVVGECSATETWISAELEAVGVDRSVIGPWLATIEAVPSPSLFVHATDGEETVGAGFGVLGGGFIGVFEVAVRPEHRRRGHARRMMDALHSWGYGLGAQQAFLQVVEENDAALGLYRSIEYEPAYRYWYRRADV